MPGAEERIWGVYQGAYRAYAAALREVAREALREAGGDFRAARKGVLAALQAPLERGGLPDHVARPLSSLDASPEARAALQSLDPHEFRWAIRRYADGREVAPEDALANYIEGGLANLRRVRREAYAVLARDYERRREEASRRKRVLERGEAHVLHRHNALMGRLVPFPGEGAEDDDLFGADAETLRAMAGEPDLLVGLDKLVEVLSIFREAGRPAPEVLLHDLRREPREGVLLEDVASADLWGLYENRHRFGSLGRLERTEDRRLMLNGARLPGGWTVLAKWVEACRERLWSADADGDFVPGFEAVAHQVAEETRERAKARSPRKQRNTDAEDRARLVFAEAVGQEALQEMEARGRVGVKSRNGRVYILDRSGGVWRMDTGERLCVRGGERLPRYEMLLSRYLTLRDRPEEVHRPDPAELLMPGPHPGEAP